MEVAPAAKTENESNHKNSDGKARCDPTDNQADRAGVCERWLRRGGRDVLI